MYKRMCKSSRGNPYHYPKGHPLGGQFAPKGYAGAAASVNGHYFDNRQDFRDYKNSEAFEQETRDYYEKNQTMKRFESPVSPETKNFAEVIHQKTGQPLPKEKTEWAYRMYCEENQVDTFGAVSDKQGRFAAHLEGEALQLGMKTPLVLSSDDRYGSNTADYIGTSKELKGLRETGTWEKQEDGTLRCVYPNGYIRKDGTESTSTSKYAVWGDGHGGYIVGKIVKRKHTDKDGNKKEVERREVIIRETKNGGQIKSLADAKRSCSIACVSEYNARNGQHGKAAKRSYARVESNMQSWEEMKNPDNWAENGGSYSFENEYGTYNVIQNEEGDWAVQRKVPTTQRTRKNYNPTTGTYNVSQVHHERTEYVGNHFDSPTEAMNHAVAHERDVMLEKRYNPDRLTAREKNAMTEEQKKNYNKFFRTLKKHRKDNQKK